jgi:hypothetical protein
LGNTIHSRPGFCGHAVGKGSRADAVAPSLAPVLIAFFLHRFRDQAETEDLTQEAFVHRQGSAAAFAIAVGQRTVVATGKPVQR